MRRETTLQLARPRTTPVRRRWWLPTTTASRKAQHREALRLPVASGSNSPDNKTSGLELEAGEAQRTQTSHSTPSSSSPTLTATHQRAPASEHQHDNASLQHDGSARHCTSSRPARPTACGRISHQDRRCRSNITFQEAPPPPLRERNLSGTQTSSAAAALPSSAARRRTSKHKRPLHLDHQGATADAGRHGAEAKTRGGSQRSGQALDHQDRWRHEATANTTQHRDASFSARLQRFRLTEACEKTARRRSSQLRSCPPRCSRHAVRRRRISCHHRIHDDAPAARRSASGDDSSVCASARCATLQNPSSA